MYSYSESQRDALFINFILGNNFMCFGLYLLSIIRSLNTVFTTTGICHSSCVDCLLADSQQVELFTKIKLINSVSCWLLL